MRTTLISLCLAATPALATDTDRFAWGENIGWLNWQGQRDDSGVPFGGGRARFFPDHLRGWVWGENVGWFNLGQSGPYPDAALQTVLPNAFGVNIGPGGELSGYAWGENVGWVNFGPFDSSVTDSVGNSIQPRIENGRLRGLAWGENIGWINLGDEITENNGAITVTGASTNFAVEVFCASDLAAPFGIVDLNDIDAFILGFLESTGLADIVAPYGIIDLADVDEFILGFLAGCP
ncbi:MAG: hypothetical protein AAGI53_09190 [Planctomycetota bacterium]